VEETQEDTIQIREAVMKRQLNFCQQGDVQHPCAFRIVVPVYDASRSPEYVKICCSKIPASCSKVSMDIDFQTRNVFCSSPQ
jgi:hypothetical protein